MLFQLGNLGCQHLTDQLHFSFEGDVSGNFVYLMAIKMMAKTEQYYQNTLFFSFFFNGNY